MPLNYSVRNLSRKWRSRITRFNFWCCIPVYLLIQLLLVLLLPVFFLVDILTCGMFGDKNLYTYIGGERALAGIFGYYTTRHKVSAATISHQSDSENSGDKESTTEDPEIISKLTPNAPDAQIDSRDDLPPPYSEFEL